MSSGEFRTPAKPAGKELGRAGSAMRRGAQGFFEQEVEQRNDGSRAMRELEETAERREEAEEKESRWEEKRTRKKRKKKRDWRGRVLSDLERR